jgi:dTDP-4-dehydrorhamnose 3,5-epimerase
MSFRFRELDIPGMVLVEPTRHRDGRGFFQETYRRSLFESGGIDLEFVQDNFARSTKGVLRGLHMQLPPRPQGKLVTAVRGAVFDVGVDLRVGSPTYGSWKGVTLDETTGALLYLPPGLAHGYAVLSPEADLAYKVTEEYAPELDAGIRWDDPDVGVDWPLEDPVLSEKDRGLPLLREFESPYRFVETSP